MKDMRSDTPSRTKPRVKSTLARQIVAAPRFASTQLVDGQGYVLVKLSSKKLLYSKPKFAKLAVKLGYVGKIKGQSQRSGLRALENRQCVKLLGTQFQGRFKRVFLVKSAGRPEMVRPAWSSQSGETQRTPVVSDSSFDLSPRAKAILKGVEIAENDLRESGGTYKEEEVQRLLHNASKLDIENEVRDKKLLTVPGPRGNTRFPAIQFKEDGTVIDGLDVVQKALPTENSFAVLNFLIHGDSRLGNESPIELLKRGQVAPVIELARGFGEQGA